MVMAYCSNCGNPLSENANFCSTCGAKTPFADTSDNPPDPDGVNNFFHTIVNGQEAYNEQRDIENNKVMAVLAYLGILVLVPLFGAQDSKFARFHTNQGLVLCVAGIIYWIATAVVLGILYMIFWRLGMVFSTIFSLVWLGFLALAIIGIINAASGKIKELPIIGHFRILK